MKIVICARECSELRVLGRDGEGGEFIDIEGERGANVACVGAGRPE